MRMKLLIATRNRHKIEEIRAILHDTAIELIGAHEIPGLPEVVEDAATFEGNAMKKARELGVAGGLWTLADDSGLEVFALGGAPGVYSARYAGVESDHAANNAKLLAALQGVADRRAQFRCVLALYRPDGSTACVEGICKGKIASQPDGSNGFGYDPLFIPDGYDQTFAALSLEEKNRISHRAMALKAARKAWFDKQT